MTPERTYTAAEIVASLALPGGSFREEIEQLKCQVADLTAEVKKLRERREREPEPISTRSKVWLSKRDAAGMLSISVSTLDVLIARGELKTRRMGKRMLIPREELDKVAKRDFPEAWPAKENGRTVRK